MLKRMYIRSFDASRLRTGQTYSAPVIESLCAKSVLYGSASMLEAGTMQVLISWVGMHESS
jgi:hypothetical protein